MSYCSDELSQGSMRYGCDFGSKDITAVSAVRIDGERLSIASTIMEAAGAAATKEGTKVAISNAFKLAAAAAALAEETKPLIMPNCYLPFIPADTVTDNKSGEEAEAARLGITVEKLISFKAYAAKLHMKYPHKGKSWLQRKVCEHFKIRLT